MCNSSGFALRMAELLQESGCGRRSLSVFPEVCSPKISASPVCIPAPLLHRTLDLSPCIQSLWQGAIPSAVAGDDKAWIKRFDSASLRGVHLHNFLLEPFLLLSGKRGGQRFAHCVFFFLGQPCFFPETNLFNRRDHHEHSVSMTVVFQPMRRVPV